MQTSPQKLTMLAPICARICILVFATTAVAGTLTAQSPEDEGSENAQPDPPELVKRRAAFTSSLRKLLLPLNRSYITALKKTERELALAGDYEGAIEARSERQRMTEILVASTTEAPTVPDGGTPTPTPVPVDPTTVFSLKASEAVPSEGVSAIGSGATINATDDSLTWKLLQPIPGGFDVSITYTSSGDASFWIRENFFRLKGEVSEGKSNTVKLGTLKITEDAESITLLAIDIPASGLVVESLTITQNPE
jgi:hypothetical protein